MLFDERRKELMVKVLPAMGRFLGARERSSGEVVAYLKRKQLCFAEDYDQVLDLLTDQGWLDDRRFTRNRVWHRLRDGYGPLYIRNDLMKFAVPRQIIDEVFAGFDDADFLDAALVAVQKKQRSALARADPNSVMLRALQYRGFSFRHSEQALRRWQAGRSDEDGSGEAREFPGEAGRRAAGDQEFL